MSHISAFSVVASIMIAGAAPMISRAAGIIPMPGSSSLTIRIYDYAHIPEQTLARAMETTQTIYQKTGIQVRLVRCRVAPSDPLLHGCHRESTGPSVIQVRILPEEMASMARLDRRVFGFAMTATRPEYGVIANVFYHSVQRLAADHDYRGYKAGVVLGHVLAHEVGHLLLGDGGHSKLGVMRISWGKAELFLAHTGGLNFTRDEATQIRRDVEERIEAQREKDPPRVLVVDGPVEAANRAGG